MLILYCIPYLLTATLSLASPFSSASTALVPRDGRGSVVTSLDGLAWYEPDLTCGTAGRDVSKYTCYSGPAKNFPQISKWMSFNAMWKNQVKYALKPIGDSALERNAIHDGIVKVSKMAKVDARVILAVIIHEVCINLLHYFLSTLYTCYILEATNNTTVHRQPQRHLHHLPKRRRPKLRTHAILQRNRQILQREHAA